MTPLRRSLPAAATALVLSLGLAACGSDDEGDSAAKSSDKASSSTSASSDPAAAAASAAASAAANPNAGKAAGTPAFCAAVQKVIGVMTSIKGDLPDEAEWKKIQTEYAGLGKVDLPADANADQKKGREVITKAITSLSYADASKAFGNKDASAAIPGVSAADQKLAEDFLTYAGTTCAAAAAQ